MADITLQPTNASTQTGNGNATLNIEESFEQATLPLAADYDEGTPVFVNSSAKFQASDASAAGTAKFYGVTAKKGKAGEPRTAIAGGVAGGYDFSAQGYGDDIYLSDTEGKLSDTPGTVSVKVGEIIPALGQPRGQNPAKLLRIKS